jgi:FtsH-binding integral membrane protein
MAFEVRGAVSGDAQVGRSDQASATAAFMTKVYGWMMAGIGITAVTAFVTFSTPALMQIVLPLYLPLIIAELVLVFAFSFLSQRASPFVAGLMFLGYALLSGLTFSVIGLRYTGASIAGVFATTALMYGGMTVYGAVTKKDLSPWRTFLVMGLWGIIIASIVNLFLGSGMLNFILGCAGVLVFAGLTAYDNQKLREMHRAFGDRGNLAINGALMLYLDFINLFISLLRLFGSRR